MVAIDSLVNRIFNDYDHNRNGVIELRGFRDEDTRTTSTRTREFNRDVLVVKEHSHKQLFNAADRNWDGKVTRHELKDVLRNYDWNRNGFLESRDPWNNGYNGELESFERAYRETERVVRREVINHYPPYNPPHHPPHHPHPVPPPYYPPHPAPKPPHGGHPHNPPHGGHPVPPPYNPPHPAPKPPHGGHGSKPPHGGHGNGKPTHGHGSSTGVHVKAGASVSAGVSFKIKL